MGFLLWASAAHRVSRGCLREGGDLPIRYNAVPMPGSSAVILLGQDLRALSRMQQRSGHYMRAQMLQSQFDTLEEPTGALTLDVALSIDQIVEEIMRQTFDKTSS